MHTCAAQATSPLPLPHLPHRREAFVELHSSPLLKQLHEGFTRRYPQVDWSELPPPRLGELDVRVVRDSPYFFS